MEKNINLKREQLKKIFDKYITTKQYGKFKEIIDEILYRRAITFDFSNKRMEEESKRLSENLKGIYFYQGEPEDSKMGYYHLNDKTISFNTLSVKKLQSYLDKANCSDVKNILLGQKIFHILSHEVYHAISPDGITDKREYNSDKLNYTSYRIAINEVITESSSNITTTYEKMDNEKGFLISNGYPVITFTGALLSCALGVSEKELYKWSLNNREEYNSFLKTKLYNGINNPTYTNYEDFLDFYLITSKDKNAIGKVDFLSLISAIPSISLDVCNQESWIGINNLCPEILGKEYTKYKRFNLILNTYIKSLQGNSTQNQVGDELNKKMNVFRDTIKRRTSNIYLLYYILKETNYVLDEEIIGNALIGQEIDLNEDKNLPDIIKKMLKNSPDDNIQLMLNEFKNSREFHKPLHDITRMQANDRLGYDENIEETTFNIYLDALKETSKHYMVTPEKIAKADMFQQITETETKKLPKLIQIIKNKLMKDRGDY